MACIAKLTPEIALLEKWEADLIWARKQLVDEVLTGTGPRDGRLRNLEVSIGVIDRGLGHADATGWSLETLRLGALLRERGYEASTPIENQAMGLLPWHRSLPATAERLKDLRAQRDDAQSRLDGFVREADALAATT